MSRLLLLSIGSFTLNPLLTAVLVILILLRWPVCDVALDIKPVYTGLVFLLAALNKGKNELDDL